MRHSGMTRRELLRSLGVGTAGVGLAGLPALAAGAQAVDRASAFYRLSVGDLELTIIQEGVVTLQLSAFGVDAPAEAVAALAAAHRLPGDSFRVTINTALLRSGDRLVLLDVGGGALNIGAFDTDRLVATLSLLDVAPEAITDVVISHFHPDHLGGLTTRAGAPVFANALHHLCDREHDFLTQTRGGPLRDLIAIAQDALQPAVATDRLSLFAADAEILPGLSAFPAPGHSPGHVAFVIASGDESLFALSDIASHSVLMLARPAWHVRFDTDLAEAAATRQTVLGMLADDGQRVFGYHFPFPGLGYVLRDGDGFRYLAAEG